VRSLALAGLTALLVIPVARAGDPPARAGDTGEVAKPEDRNQRPDRPIAERYAEIRAEFEAQWAAQAAYYQALQAATKAGMRRDRTEATKKRPADLVTDYSRGI
jgi:hypothetical protein